MKRISKIALAVAIALPTIGLCSALRVSASPVTNKVCYFHNDALLKTGFNFATYPVAAFPQELRPDCGRPLVAGHILHAGEASCSGEIQELSLRLGDRSLVIGSGFEPSTCDAV